MDCRSVLMSRVRTCENWATQATPSHASFQAFSFFDKSKCSQPQTVVFALSTPLVAARLSLVVPWGVLVGFLLHQVEHCTSARVFITSNRSKTLLAPLFRLYQTFTVPFKQQVHLIFTLHRLYLAIPSMIYQAHHRLNLHHHMAAGSHSAALPHVLNIAPTQRSSFRTWMLTSTTPYLRTGTHGKTPRLQTIRVGILKDQITRMMAEAISSTMQVTTTIMVTLTTSE